MRSSDPDWDEIARRSDRIRQQAAAAGPFDLAEIVGAIEGIAIDEVETAARADMLAARVATPGTAHAAGRAARQALLILAGLKLLRALIPREHEVLVLIGPPPVDPP